MRACTQVECVTKKKAKQLVVKQHIKEGHLGCDVIKITLTNYVYSSKLNVSIMTAISNCTTLQTDHLALSGQDQNDTTS